MLYQHFEFFSDEIDPILEQYLPIQCKNIGIKLNNDKWKTFFPSTGLKTI